MKKVVVDYSNKYQLELHGGDRKNFLHGMCTSQIKEMKAGDWLYTSCLNAKGRVLATFDVLAFEESIVLVADKHVGEKVYELFDSHIIADDVELSKRQGALFKIWSDIPSVWSAKLTEGECHEEFSDEEAIECRRIEAGFPKYDQDVSESYFPFESGLEQYIDYKKGCYLGQEPVARVKYKGEPKKVLCGFTFSDNDFPALGATIAHSEKPNAGVLTSKVVSPNFGPIGLGYVYKSVFTSGAEVSIEGKKAMMRLSLIHI